jgi:hypothetical protein
LQGRNIRVRISTYLHKSLDMAKPEAIALHLYLATQK